jgi:hypothetical protein
VADKAQEGDEYIIAEEARQILGVGVNRMAQLLKDGVLPFERSPLDRRIKLIKRSDVEELAKKARPKILAAA